MAKISISGVLKTRVKFRLATLLACLVLVFVLGQIILSKSPKSVRASTCNINWTGSYIDSSCENQDVIIDGATINMDTIKVDYSDPFHPRRCTDAEDMTPNCDTKRHFQSLTLRNGAVLTHTALTTADMSQDSPLYGITRAAGTTGLTTTTDGSLADNLTGSARWKKVDLVVAGAVTMSGGSSINVNGKGYPSNGGNGGKAYGPGGGENANAPANRCQSGDDNCTGGGGGYGTTGFYGWNTAGGASYGNENIPDDKNFEWGSAGGYGSDAVGGAGGGRIRVITDTLNMVNGTFVFISADGINGSAGNNGNYGGSGSGGSVKIVILSKFTGSVIPQVHAESKTQDVNLNGSVKLLNFSSSNLPNTVDLTISSYGGYSVPRNGSANVTLLGSAAGGRIYIQQALAPLVTVSKKLVANTRVGVTPANNFNPYALQVGDIIEVDLTVGSYTGSPTIVDEMLSLPPGSSPMRFCIFKSGTFVKPTGTSAIATPAPDGKTVTISNLPLNNTGSRLMTYKCTVQ